MSVFYQRLSHLIKVRMCALSLGALVGVYLVLCSIFNPNSHCISFIPIDCQFVGGLFMTLICSAYLMKIYNQIKVELFDIEYK